MGTFVLVPGAGFGAWSWRKVIPLLRAAGHTAHPISLTGLGERIHLAGPQVDLETHVTDVVNLLIYEDLADAVLVGHSYGGMVIAGVADRVPERVRRLVYLDAVIPAAGEGLADIRPEFVAWVEGAGGGQDLLDPPTLRAIDADLTEEEARWASARATAQPLATLRQPLRLRHPEAAAAVTCVWCRRSWEGDELFPVDVARARAQLGWQHIELDAGHLVPLTRPRLLAEALVGLG